MLQYSFSTVLMAVLSSNIIIIFTAVCFCRKDLLVSIGYKMFALLLGIAFLRFAFPFQFSFTTNLVFPDTLSRGISFLRYYFYQSEYINISIWGIFESVWIIGILVRLGIFVIRHLAFNHRVVWQSRNLTDDERYSHLLDEICGDGPNPFSVYELGGLKVPVLYGIRHPRILVPAGMEMPERELRYLLSHETAHHYHHDILIKLGLSLLTIIYWWNPACYVLKAQLDAVLEMRVDNYVAGDNFDSKFGYLNCLVYVAEHTVDQAEKSIKLPESSIALFNLKQYSALTNRFDVMGGEPKPYARVLHVTALAMTVALFLFSYFFIFEARYAAPEEDMQTVDLSGPSTYAVLNDDNTYDVYYGGYQMDTVDTLDNYYEGMVVYDSLDEVPAELFAIIE